MTSRHTRLTAALRAADLSAVALVPGPNLRYLTGLDLHASERIALLLLGADGQAALALPQLEQPRAEAQASIPISFFPWTDEQGPAAAVAAAVTAIAPHGSVAVEYTAMRVLELRALETAAPDVTVVDATPVLASLRMRKDADELAAMRQAVAIIEGALQATIDQLRVGLTEQEVAAIWEREIGVRGGSPSFTTIVASGPNSANPHHSPTDRQLQRGDLVILDGGAWYAGYASDITRTIAIGEPGPQARRIYEVVQLANAIGRAAAAQPAVSGAGVDSAAREVIEDAGFGEYFVHRTGHGLGMEVHEPPYIVSTNHEPLPRGATFSVEPGVYVAGTGGVRIEDDVVITETGAESLTSFPRELIIVER